MRATLEYPNSSVVTETPTIHLLDAVESRGEAGGPHDTLVVQRVVQSRGSGIRQFCACRRVSCVWNRAGCLARVVNQPAVSCGSRFKDRRKRMRDMTISRRSLLVASAALAAFLPFGASQAHDLSVTIGYQTVVEPSKVPQADGVYEKAAHATIDWRKFDSGAEVIAAVASGRLTSAMSGPARLPPRPAVSCQSRRSSWSG